MNNSFNSMKSMFKGAAMAVAQGYRDANLLRKERSYEELKHTNKGNIKARQAGQGTRGRHYVMHRRQGPFFRQIGVKHLYNNEQEFVCTKAVVEKFYVLQSLHATKGWRTKTHSVGTSLVSV